MLNLQETSKNVCKCPIFFVPLHLKLPTPMNRYQFAHLIQRVLHLHYIVKKDGFEHVLDGKVHLIMPNHPAYVDPVILGSECWQIPLRPMCDAWIFENKLFAYIVRRVDALVVPDVAAAPADQRAEVAEQVRNLSRDVLELLRNGEEICFYPSGHIKLTDKEELGNRRLAYEVCRELPDNVEVLMVRTRGLESSHFSRLKTRFKLFRKVHIHFEVMTDDVKEWARLDRREFNAKMEEWYNQLDNI